MKKHAFLSPNQSTFRNNFSTQTSLHKVIDGWLEATENKCVTLVCCYDLKKCFDSIEHHILLNKLSMHGIKTLNIHGLNHTLMTGLRLVFIKIASPLSLMLIPVYLKDLSWDLYYSSSLSLILLIFYMDVILIFMLMTFYFMPLMTILIVQLHIYRMTSINCHNGLKITNSQLILIKLFLFLLAQNKDYLPLLNYPIYIYR